MGRRQEKEKRLAALKVLVLSGKVTAEEGFALEAAYRCARTPAEFDEVSRAVDLAANGWKTQGDAYSHLMRAANDMDSWDDKPDPPALAAAIERARVKL